MIELLICVGIVMIIGAITIPYLTGALQTTGETAAIENIRTIHTAQAQYFAKRNRSAGKLDDFALKELSTALRDSEHSGYTFRLELTSVGYAIYAAPAKGSKLGVETYDSDETMVVRHPRGQQAGPTGDTSD